MKIPVQMKHQKSAQCDSQKKKKNLLKAIFKTFLPILQLPETKQEENKNKRALGVRSFQVTGNIPEAKPKKTNEELEEK